MLAFLPDPVLLHIVGRNDALLRTLQRTAGQAQTLERREEARQNVCERLKVQNEVIFRDVHLTSCLFISFRGCHNLEVEKPDQSKMNRKIETIPRKTFSPASKKCFFPFLTDVTDVF